MGHYIQDQPNFYPVPNIPESYMVSRVYQNFGIFTFVSLIGFNHLLLKIY